MIGAYSNILFLCLTFVGTVHASIITHAVTNFQCGREFTIGETTLFLYSGTSLSFPCDIELKPSDTLDNICVTVTRYDSNCGVDVEFYDGFNLGFPDKEVDCFNSIPTEEHCTSLSSLYVVFDRTRSGSITSGNTIEVKAFTKKNEDIRMSVGIIVGVILSVIVVLGVVSLFIVLVYCRQRGRRAAAGVVYNQGRTTVITQAQYPQQGTGYPSQPMLQPYYPAGNQQTGFSQPMAGFAPPQQTYGAEFTAPPPAYSSLEISPTAPPLSDNAGNQSQAY